MGFTYGSKHNKYENAAAEKIAAFYQVPYELIDLTGVMKHFKSNLLQSGGEIPEGHYEAESMRQTVVPGRNMIFTSILAGLAASNDANEIWLGVHAGDHFIYPDCRPEFIVYMEKTIRLAIDAPSLQIVTPFLTVTKKEILRRGLVCTPKVPYHLTRTCYKDQPIACGKCGSCQERLAAWEANGRTDPIEYESRIILTKDGK